MKLIISALFLAFHASTFGAVYMWDVANTLLRNPAGTGTSLNAVTNNITIVWRHTIGVSNNGGNYISRNQGWRVKNSGGPHPLQFDFVYTDFQGGAHQWRTTAESYGVKHGYIYSAVTFTYGNGSSLRYYTNGVSQAGSWISGNGNVLGTNMSLETKIGGHAGGAGCQIGYYSDYAVWNSILSLQQLELIRKAKVKGIELQVSPRLLRAWLPLDNAPNGLISPATINLFIDRSGFGNNFTAETGLARPAGMVERVCSYQPNE